MTFLTKAAGSTSLSSTDAMATLSSRRSTTSGGMPHRSTKRRLKFTMPPPASTTRIASAVASIVALSRATDRCRSSWACLRSVMSNAMPMTPWIAPAASRKGSTCAWNVRCFQVISYVTDSPASARRWAAIGSNSGSVVRK